MMITYFLFVNSHLGWDKQSYGYHGDDGHSFCSSGTGQPYGPTFTTGDVIGCGVNLIDNTCFYTKNGHYLGTAFTDLPVRNTQNLTFNQKTKRWTICIVAKSVSHCWATDARRSCRCEFRPRTVCIRYRGYDEGVAYED